MPRPNNESNSARSVHSERLRLELDLLAELPSVRPEWAPKPDAADASEREQAAECRARANGERTPP